MADRFIIWPPPEEALVPLVKDVARAMAEEHFDAGEGNSEPGKLGKFFSPTARAGDA